MSAKGEKIMGKSLVFIGQTGGASISNTLRPIFCCDPFWGCYRLVSRAKVIENQGADEELSDGGSPRVIVYRYDGLPMQSVALPSSDYVPGPEHPPSPDYVPGPEHPPSPVEVPYVPEPEYPKYFVPSNNEVPMEDQPLPADATPVALSLGCVADSDLEEDPEEDHTDYPANGGDGDDEPSDDEDDDDDDTDGEDKEPFEDDDNDEEYTDAFETDESAPIPRSPQTKVPFAQTRLRRA
ncbi:hypothetical protein Tco_0484277 [Tanacetum coccineum]